MTVRLSSARRETAASTTAFWGLLGLAVLSVVIRPVADVLRLPSSVTNLDAVLVPPVAGAVVALVLLSWRTQPRTTRVPTGALLALALCILASWALGDTTTWAGFGLGFLSVALFPLTLFLVAVGLVSARLPLALMVLRLFVLLQLVFGLWQYVAFDVAAHAPFRADLVDGTTSHNFWPVFALPASLVLVVVDRGGHRFIWPAAVVLLATYAEAKAALIVWVPAIILVLALMANRWVKDDRARPRAASVDRLLRAALVAAFVGVVMGGLWWTPSVQGTGSVFVGHSKDLGNLVENRKQTESYPTLREAVAVLGDTVPATARTFLFGLGPANSVSHAAEVLAQGPRNGVSLPPPGPVAVRLFKGGDTKLKFEDAQSSLLGVWGDLGAVGALAYLTATVSCVWALLAPAWDGWPRSGVKTLTAVLLVLGVFAGGLLLDWPEQAGVVLPMALAIWVVAQVPPSARPARHAVAVPEARKLPW